MNICCPVCGQNHPQNHHHKSAAPNVSAATGQMACETQCHCHELEDDSEEEEGSCCCRVPESSDSNLNAAAIDASGRAVYRIDNMDCPMEEALIRNKLKDISGVTALDFNLMKRLLTVHHELDSLTEVEEALISIEMLPVRINGESQPAPPEKSQSRWLILALASGLALMAEVVHFIFGNHWLVLVSALAAIALGGLSTYKKGWVAIKNLNLNMNALMSFAVTGAMIIGQWPEAAMVMILFTLAEALEARSLARARDAIGNLLCLTPEKATVRHDDGTWQQQAATEIKPGSLVRIRPGEKVALDGIIVSGSSAVNQAPITGESLPIEKTVGDQVFAGSINEMASFEYTATAAFENSTLARIIKAVEEAQASRAPIQRFVDRFASIYTPIVFALAVLTGILPPLLFGEPWLDWAYKALVLLMVACPCALVISTPVTIVSGLAAGARQGLLIKGGSFLEQGRRLKVIAFDKTGTITKGKPQETAFLPWAGNEPHQARRLAASLAGRSDHPVSQAVAEAARLAGIDEHLTVEDFTALPGLGIRGTIAGRGYVLGNHKVIHDGGWCDNALEEEVTRLEKDGQSVICLADEKSGVMAVFAVADSLKPGSRAAVDELRAMGIATVMLTGDNTAVARAVAAEVGIEQVQGGLLPEEKLAAIEELLKGTRERGLVGMAGDGINDAPALARADIGFAMGAAGTGTVIETADVAIMDDQLAKIPAFIRLSRRAGCLLRQNIALTLVIKAAFLLMTFFGQTTMWMAVFADIGVSLMVVANGLRLLRR